jgi:hypothetical protein
MRSMQRRIAALEVVLADSLMPDYGPLTPSEIAAITGKIGSGAMLTKIEVNRLERQSPLIDGEFLVTCYHGNVTAKRYVGIDLVNEL